MAVCPQLAGMGEDERVRLFEAYQHSRGDPEELLRKWREGAGRDACKDAAPDQGHASRGRKANR